MSKQKFAVINCTTQPTIDQQAAFLAMIRDRTQKEVKKTVLVRVSKSECITGLFSLVEQTIEGIDCRYIKKSRNVSKLERKLAKIINNGSYNLVIVLMSLKDEYKVTRLCKHLGFTLQEPDKIRIVCDPLYYIAQKPKSNKVEIASF